MNRKARKQEEANRLFEERRAAEQAEREANLEKINRISKLDDPKKLQSLAYEKDWLTQRLVANNPNTPKTNLEYLAQKSPYSFVRYDAAQTLKSLERVVKEDPMLQMFIKNAIPWPPGHGPNQAQGMEM